MDLYPVYVMILFLQVVMCEPPKYVCKKTNDSDVQANLICNSNQMIHVISETYANGTLQNGCLNTTKTCTVVLKNDGQGLYVNCNGKQNCSEKTDLVDVTRCSPVQGSEIQYECVEDSLDVCRTREELTNGSVYLHSPNFPDSSGVNDSCTCRITGTLMSIQLIQHLGRKKDLNISTDGDNLEQGVTPVNRIIAKRANHITLNYQSLEDGRFWIKVRGPGMIDVECLNESSNMPSTSMATTTPNKLKESTSTGMVNVTFLNEASTASSDTTSSDTTSSDTTSVGNTVESSDTGIPNEASTASSDTSSSDTTTVGNTAESSDTVTDDNDQTTTDLNVTQTTDLATNDAAGPLSIVALASIGSAGGFVALVSIIVGVICCRRMTKSKERMGHKNTDPVELGYITAKTGQSGRTSFIADHNYFQLDPDFVSLDRKKADEEASISREECRNMPQYAIVSCGSRVPAYDNNILNEGDQGMVTNDIFVSRPSNKEQPEEGMVDNFLHQTFRHSNTASAMNQSESPLTQDDIGDKDEGMVINDHNHSDQTLFVDQHLKTIAQQSPQIDHRCNSDGEGTNDRDTGGGMMVNDLYDSYQASPGNHSDGDIPALSAQTKQTDNIDQQEDTAGMVINDLYHSYQSPQKSQNLNKDQEPKGGAKESDNDSVMVENDLYCKEIKPSHVTQRISGGHYKEIVNNELRDPGDLRGQGPRPRPPAYEDIADITSVC